MKKTLSMAAIALFMMTASCSGDDSSDSNPSTETVLIKKTISTDEEGNAITTNYSYDGNKVTETTDSEGWVTKLYYNNDQLIKLEHYDNGVLDQRDIFTYNSNNQLSGFVLLDIADDWAYRMTFVHNANGTISTESFSGNVAAQNTLTDTGIITLNNGNITDYTITSTGGFETTWAYTFDSHNSPSKNIFADDVMSIAYQEGGVNNILSYTNEAYDEGYTITYQYNEAGYPVSDTETDIDGTVTTTQYFYE